MKRCIDRMILMVVVLSVAACEPVATPTEYLIFVDQSGSISEAQRTAWIETAEAILGHLSFAYSISIFPIHDHTLEASPLFRATVPDKGVSLDDLTHAKQALLRIRKQAAAALQDALTTKIQSRSTRLFDVIDKLAFLQTADKSAARQVFIFSDMLESSDELDMSRTRLPEEDLPAWIVRIQEKHRWSEEILRDTALHCILNGIETGKARAVNDRTVLKQFWGALFNHVGGHLASFETFLS